MHQNVQSSIRPGPTVTPAVAATGSSTSSSATASASNTNTQSSSNSATGTGSLWDALNNMIGVASSNITSYSSSLLDEINMYLSEPPIARNSQDPLNRWRENCQRLPQLSRVARALLAIPATSMNSERLNSTSGNIVTVKRCNLLTEHVAELTFIHENLHN